MIIRPIKAVDARQVLDIYAPFITSSFVTFENIVPSLPDFAKRIEQISQKYPWLVVTEGDQIAGYAYAGKYRDTEAYQWMVESSIYMHPDFKGKKLARRLYSALFELLKEQGFRKVFAVISVPNAESVGFHEHMGFSGFATYRNVGFKLGTWKDVGWWELPLTDQDTEPATPIPWSEMDRRQTDVILQRYNAELAERR